MIAGIVFTRIIDQMIAVCRIVGPLFDENGDGEAEPVYTAGARRRYSGPGWARGRGLEGCLVRQRGLGIEKMAEDRRQRRRGGY